MNHGPVLRKFRGAEGQEPAMEEDRPREVPDLKLSKIGKQDLYTLSVGDLKERIVSLKLEIERCEQALALRDSTKSAAEKLFKA